MYICVKCHAWLWEPYVSIFWHIFYVCNWRICLNVHCYLKLSRKCFMKFFGIVHSYIQSLFYCSSLWPWIFNRFHSQILYTSQILQAKKLHILQWFDLFWNLWWPLRLQSLACLCIKAFPLASKVFVLKYTSWPFLFIQNVRKNYVLSTNIQTHVGNSNQG